MSKLNKIDAAIRDYYQKNNLPVSSDLITAILYSVDSGGKRIRPLIFLDLLEGFGLELTPSHFDVAASLEMIHTGSLIHDDLPECRMYRDSFWKQLRLMEADSGQSCFMLRFL